MALDGDSTTFPIIYEEVFESEPLNKRISTSVNDVCLEEGFDNLLHINGESSTMKKNMRDKILNNLSRLNFSGYGKLREEYSPTATRASITNLTRINERLVDSTINKNHKIQSKESVTLVGYRSIDTNVDNKSIESTNVSNALLTDLTISNSYSLNNIQSQIGKRIVCSESLPDLSTNEVLLNIRQQILSQQSSRSVTKPVRPPHKFRDRGPSHERKGFEGTMYFPKPPKQFTIDESDEPEDHSSIETKELVNGTKYQINDKNSAKNHKKVSEEMIPIEREYTIVELLKSNKCLICGKLKCSCTHDTECLPSLRRMSAIGSDVVSFVKAKEEFRQQIANKSTNGWLIYSDFPSLASRIPYFQCDPDFRAFRYYSIIYFSPIL